MRFTIRDLLWLTVVVALGVGWFVEHRRAIAMSERVQSLSAKVEFYHKSMEGLFTMYRDAAHPGHKMSTVLDDGTTVRARDEPILPSNASKRQNLPSE